MNPEQPNMKHKIALRNANLPDYAEKFAQFNEFIARELKKRNVDKPAIFIAKPGDLLIWHSQLFHGGMPILNNFTSTRRALVTHYHSTKDHLEDSKLLVKVNPGKGHYMNREHQVVPK